MDTKKLHEVIMNETEWGNKLSEGDSFYRLLFRMDKKRDNNEIVTKEDINWVFASYKKWYEKVQELLSDCYEDCAGNREAQTFGDQLKFDVINHILTIVVESNLEEKDLTSGLQVKYDMEAARKLREEKEKESGQMIE